MTEETENWLVRHEREAKERNDGALSKLLSLIPTLRGLGYRSIHVEYSGGGDSGQSDSVSPTPNVPLSDELERQIGEWAFELSPDGFWNNDGGDGWVEIDVEAGTVEHYHGDFETVRCNESQTVWHADGTRHDAEVG
jgi:hypothetical protein